MSVSSEIDETLGISYSQCVCGLTCGSLRGRRWELTARRGNRKQVIASNCSWDVWASTSNLWIKLHTYILQMCVRMYSFQWSQHRSRAHGLCIAGDYLLLTIFLCRLLVDKITWPLNARDMTCWDSETSAMLHWCLMFLMDGWPKLITQIYYIWSYNGK